MAKRVCPKLAAKYFGPYQILARVGPAAYKLELPAHSRIHPVFFCSQLKAAIGVDKVVCPLPLEGIEELEVAPEPLEVLATRYDAQGHLELLVQWVGRPTHENSWMLLQVFEELYPFFKLEDKLGFKGKSINRYKRGYVRQKKRISNEEGDDVEERVEEIQMEGVDDVATRLEEGKTGSEVESLPLELEEEGKTFK